MAVPALPLDRKVLDAVRARLGVGEVTFVTFRTLHCTDTEDTHGHDEPYLRFQPDMTPAVLGDQVERAVRAAAGQAALPGVVVNPPPLGLVHRTRAVKEGLADEIGLTFLVVPGRPMTVSLHDDDSGPTGSLDPDDHLGTARVDVGPSAAKQRDRGTLRFTEDGADYTLTYEITTVSLVDSSTVAGRPLPVQPEPVVGDAAGTAQQAVDKVLGRR